jgi:type IV pilus assembly protein PilM
MLSALSEAMNLPATGDSVMLHDLNLLDGIEDLGEIDASQMESGQTALFKILGELTEELSRSINFYINQSEDLEIAQLLLAGPGAGISQVDNFFTQKLNLPTAKIDPVAALGLDTSQEIAPKYRPGLGIVLGLGMREQ